MTALILSVQAFSCCEEGPVLIDVFKECLCGCCRGQGGGGGVMLAGLTGCLWRMYVFNFYSEVTERGSDRQRRALVWPFAYRSRMTD